MGSSATGSAAMGSGDDRGFGRSGLAGSGFGDDRGFGDHGLGGSGFGGDGGVGPRIGHRLRDALGGELRLGRRVDGIDL